MDRNVGSLTRAVDFSDDSLLVVEQQGEAKSLEGATLKEYIRGVVGDFSDVGGGGTGGSGTMDHSKLLNRSAADQHPASSIAFSNGKTEFVSETVQGALEEISHGLTQGGLDGNVLRVPGGGDAEIDPAFGGPPYTFEFTPATSGDGGGSGGGGTGSESVEAKDVRYNNAATSLASSNVQDAIDELAQSVDDLTAGGGGEDAEPVQAKDVSYNNAATGLTPNVQGAIDELFQSVSNGKSLVASAITDKGVPTAADATFQVMAENIVQISGSGSADLTDYEWAQFSNTGGGVRESLTFSSVPEPSFAICLSWEPFSGWELCPSNGSFIYFLTINIGETDKYRIFYPHPQTGEMAASAFTLFRPITFSNGELTIPSYEMPGVPPLYFCGSYELFCLVKKT